MGKSKIKRILYLLKNGSFYHEFIIHLKHNLEKRQEKIVPQVEFSQIIPQEISEVVFDSPNADLDGNVSQEELRIICKIIKYFEPKNLFEIGTFDGRTTLHMAANSTLDSSVFTLDLPPSQVNTTKLRIKSSDATFIDKESSGREFIRKEEEKKITQLLGDSASFDFSPFKNKMDFVFVDGSHSYEYVMNDTQKAFDLLREKKGIIMWHDYGWREVVRALNELYLNNELMQKLKHIKGTSLVFLLRD